MNIITNSNDGKKLARKLGYNYFFLDEIVYPDGESCLSLIKRKGKNLVYYKFDKNKSFDHQIFNLISLLKHLKKSDLILPYLPYARSLHFKKKGQVDKFGFFMGELNNYVDTIYLLEIHCRIEQVKKYLSETNVICINVDNSLLDFINKKFSDYILVAPDKGFSEHIKRLAKLSGKNYIVFDKKRVSPTKVILAYNQKFIKKNKSNNFVIVDDIVSTGGTLLGVIGCLKNEKVKGIISVVVHNVSKQNLKQLKLFYTNSLADKNCSIDIIEDIKLAIKF